MPDRPRLAPLRLALLLTAALAWALSPRLAWAQLPAAGNAEEEDAPSGSEAVNLQIDLITLLKSDEVFKDSVDGDIWTVKASIGKKLIQIPLLIEPGEAPVDIGNSTFKLTGGRLIAYRLNDYGETNDLLELARRDAREVNEGSRARMFEKEKDPIYAPPRMATKFTLTPNGVVQYKMERRIRGGDLKAGEMLYSMKLDMQRLYARRPEAPKRAGNSREEREAAAVAALDYRMKSEEFRDLQKTVLGLSTDIEAPMPTRVWAIMEYPLTRRDLQFTGPAPLPWKIDVAQLEALRAMAAQPIQAVDGPAGEKRLEPSVLFQINQLAELAADTNPLSHRAIAHTLAQAQVVPYAQFGDTLFNLLRQLLTSPDSETRNLIMVQLTRTIPPTRASRELLTFVASQGLASGQAKVEALKGLLASGFGDNPAATGNMIGPANNMLADADGPPVADIINPLLNAARGNEATTSTLAKGIRFNAMPEKRLGEAIVLVVENAGAEPLAAAWLDEQFLSSASKAVQEQTLQVIANADTGARDLGPAVNWAIEHLFGAPGAGDGEAGLRKARMRLPIPVWSTRHGIFRALQHGDRAVRAIAWRALPRFVFPLLPQGYPTESPDRYRVLLDAALDQIPSPVEAVAFLSAQPNMARATQSLVQIVLRGSRDTSVMAVRALFGGKGPLGEVLLELGPGERQGFGMLVYQIMTKRNQPPLVVNVLRRRETNNPVAQWFGEQVALGVLPPNHEWARQFTSDDPLLDLAMSRDTELAKGAAAVLVASAGGSDRTALSFLEQLQSLPDQTRENVAATWQQQKKTIRAQQLAQYEGPYQLTLALYDTPPTGGDTPYKPVKEIVIGTMQLLVNVAESKVSFGGQPLVMSIPDERDAIRLDQPADLKNLPNEQLGQLPLEKVTEPVFLRRQENGAWLGLVQMEGAVRTELILRRPSPGS